MYDSINTCILTLIFIFRLSFSSLNVTPSDEDQCHFLSKNADYDRNYMQSYGIIRNNNSHVCPKHVSVTPRRRQTS